MEDRFIWKREKLVELVTDLLDISRENQVMLRQPMDRTRIEVQASRLRRAAEQVLLLDSGVVAMTGTHMIQAELERLSAYANASKDQSMPHDEGEELDNKCLEGSAALLSATRMILGDPTQSRFMRRSAAKILKDFRNTGRGRPQEGFSSPV